MKMATIFGSTYMCEQIFSRIQHVKSFHRLRRTVYFYSILRIGTTKRQPNILSLVDEI